MHLILAADSWSHPWEGFRTAYAHCSQDGLDWVSSLYDGEPDEPDWPRRGTISWNLNHVGACKEEYTWDIRHPTCADNPCQWRVHRNRTSLFEALERVHEDFLEACRLADPAVAIAGKGGQTLAAYVGIAVRHEIWHAGQIAMLHRMRQQTQVPAQPPGSMTQDGSRTSPAGSAREAL